MARGVATVWVPVQDMDRAVTFYKETLGLTVKSTSQDWSEFEANGLMIGLNGREKVSSFSEGGAVLTFQPDSGLDEEVERLKTLGVDFAGGISDHEWGRIAPFKDSEGNDLQIYAPPTD